MRKLYYFLFSILFFCNTISLELFASETFQIPYKPEDANIEILKVLNKLDDGKNKEEDRTRGFVHNLTHTYNSPWSYNIYVGRLNKSATESVIRIESPKTGQERMLRAIMEQEILHQAAKEDARSLNQKSMLMSQGLNVVSPVLSVWYNKYDSPALTNRDAWVRTAAYLLSDVLLLGIYTLYVNSVRERPSLQDRILFGKREEGVFDENYRNVLIGLLAVPRIYRAIGAFEDTAVHNRAFELGYTFRY